MYFSTYLKHRKKEQEIPLDLFEEKEFSIKLEYVQDNDELVEIQLIARSVWCNISKNLDYYSTGFRFIDPSPSQVKIIAFLLDELAV